MSFVSRYDTGDREEIDELVDFLDAFWKKEHIDGLENYLLNELQFANIESPVELRMHDSYHIAILLFWEVFELNSFNEVSSVAREEIVALWERFIKVINIKSVLEFLPLKRFLLIMEDTGSLEVLTGAVNILAWLVSEDEGEETSDFLDYTQFLGEVLKWYLTENSAGECVDSLFELLHECLDDALDKAIELLDKSIDELPLVYNSAKMERYHEVFEIVLDREHEIPESLLLMVVCMADLEEFSEQNGDLETLIEYYTALWEILEKSPNMFPMLESRIRAILGLLERGLDELSVEPSLARFFEKLTSCTSHYVNQWAKQEDSMKRIIRKLSFKEPQHLKVLEIINYSFIEDKCTFFNDKLQTLVLSKDTDARRAILGVMKDPEFFAMFASNGQLSMDVFRQMEEPLLHEYLVSLSQHSHSYEYLLENTTGAVRVYWKMVKGDYR
ncbi:hypothetical protein C7M61_004496 [Candidozyma pseudohaemuli]|uniref:Uncharacterized protein n=1 Tax=Candidozyma pseudohaemuli TaxID=418784 RepID=A0A2P7YHL6_9ASCO|nr:hypothetical protein C7M61_004496 [[Candida] pseudohaemulonii]PSK35460.1 hypothetical protein C7M61_004496 [[Candida] pseudohaemulonii]